MPRFEATTTAGVYECRRRSRSGRSSCRAGPVAVAPPTTTRSRRGEQRGADAGLHGDDREGRQHDDDPVAGPRSASRGYVSWSSRRDDHDGHPLDASHGAPDDPSRPSSRRSGNSVPVRRECTGSTIGAAPTVAGDGRDGGEVGTGAGQGSPRARYRARARASPCRWRTRAITFRHGTKIVP